MKKLSLVLYTLLFTFISVSNKPVSAFEKPKVKCASERVLPLPLRQAEMQCVINDGKKVIVAFPVETGKYKRFKHGPELFEVPEKINEYYEFDVKNREFKLLPDYQKSNQKINSQIRTTINTCTEEFKYVDSKGRKWEVLCGQHFIKLKCFDKGKLVVDSDASWTRGINDSRVYLLNHPLNLFKFGDRYEFENWPYPPAIFLKLIFDKKDNPILLTRDQGIFRFENGAWKWIFYTPELQLDEIAYISILLDNRICLVTHPTFPGSDYKRLVRRNGIVIFDPVKNEYQIIRIKMTG